MVDKVVDIAKGKGLPLGVSRIGKKQWQFSIAKDHTKEITLLLFAAGEKEEVASITLFSAYLVGGIYSVIVTFADESIDEYAYLIDGKMCLDPYAKLLSGRKAFGEKHENVHACMVKSTKIVSEPLYTPFHELVLYRMHVRGYTMDPTSKVKNKGTFKGLVEKIPYLKELGINGIVLLPCYEFDETIELSKQGSSKPSNFLAYTRPLTEEQMEEQNFPEVNFWGYTDKCQYFAPKAAYAANPSKAIIEMKNMVKKMHENGICVFMEMFFANQTNQVLIGECLRYWVTEYGIDGFKINTEVVNSQIVANDPVLARTKFMATYWDTSICYEPYEKVEEKILAEYNDGFMVDGRRFLKSDEGQVNAFLERFRKNPDQQTVINYITNINGFTLMDLVSYDVKHNNQNGEQGMDGTEYNYSWNCGWEGPTKRKQIVQLRLRQIKNALVFLLLSQGVPMLLAGDEFGNTQFGNNNAYCQDNEIGWVIWKKQAMNQRILQFTKSMIRLRKEHPVFSPKHALRAMDYIACGCPDISFHGTKPWYPDLSNYSRVLGIMLYGKYAPLSIRRSDRSYYIAFNMHWESHVFELPVLPKKKKWRVIVDTYQSQKDLKKSENNQETPNEVLQYKVEARSVVVFEEFEDKNKK